ncbi:SPP1 family phage portal protein [Brevibacillus sp. AG162]|uniref:phage portal protein n=1 Tax=Brevibacillus sp. AG162 TaxID=2572910 RepID=UPI00114F9A45|nr:phage portal protein [Brevibacillus sp. AG162]TQK41958.1 SPP1 family phage portal protein [Brevibacillus sp. AG162]
MFEKYIDLIEQHGVTAKVLGDLIQDHASLRGRMLANYERYKAEKDGQGVPIYQRKFEVESANKINSKLANDFFSEIIDTKVGYLFGNPVVFMLDKKTPDYNILNQRIERFNKVNNLADTNSEAGKFAAMCGYDGLLLYIDKEGQERIIRVDPWETIILTRSEITEPTYGIRYFKTYDDQCKVEFYDDKQRRVFMGESWEKLVEDTRQTKLHMFDYCPLFGLPNNAELQGDADKVLSLIDAYDRALSDGNSEIEQFRLAYMIFLGYVPDEETVRKAKELGALYIPEIENGEDIKFLTKQLDVQFLDSHLDRLEENITRFSKHVNFTNAFGGGTVTGPAMRYKLFMLETKAKTMERKHEAAMMYMFKVLASAWAKKGFQLDYTMLELKYTRNIPVNLLDEADTAQKFLGVLSMRTILSNISVVPDVDEEMRRIEEERDSRIDLDDKSLEDEEDQESHQEE